MQNFAAVADKLRAARAVVEVADEAALAEAVDALLRDPVRRIDSGILRRKGESASELVRAFMQFVMESQHASVAAPSSKGAGRGSGRRATTGRR